jgi:tight adherence protein C
MEFIIAFSVFLLLNILFIPFDTLMPKSNLRKLLGKIQDKEKEYSVFSATNLMEKIIKIGERFYKFGKNKFSYETYIKYSKDIVVAGLNERMTTEGVLGAKIFLSLAIMFYVMLMGLLTGAVLLVVISPIGGAIGYIYPDIFIKGKIQKRKWQIQKELPGILNTLAIITDAGLGLFESIEKVCEIREGEFVLELQKVNQEVKVGVLRKDAFLRMSDRCQVNEVSSFISALLQVLEKGSSGIAIFLKNQSTELWNKRMNYARELGAKASIKLFLPMLFLVLPATLIFLAGPVVIQLIEKLF